MLKLFRKIFSEKFLFLLRQLKSLFTGLFNKKTADGAFTKDNSEEPPEEEPLSEDLSQEEPETEAEENGGEAEPEETPAEETEPEPDEEIREEAFEEEPEEVSEGEFEEEVSLSKNFDENMLTEENEEDEEDEENKEGLEKMKLSEGEAAVEAILFAAGDPVEIDSIAKVIGEDRATAESLVESLIIKYNSEKRGIGIIKINDGYQMCTNRQFYNYIDRLFKQPKRKNMSQAILEVLAIIAYKQPVTKTEIEEIRGINSDRMVNKLVEYNLVCEMGRKKVPGRPILFGTTDEFLRDFGYSSREALPELKSPDVNAFDEAAREVSERLEKAAKKAT